jgi:hypothetical protein
MVNTQLQMTSEGRYIRITFAPADIITFEGLLPKWALILEICRKQGCNVVLVEAAKMCLQISRIDAFELAHMLFQMRCCGLRVAFCVCEHSADGSPYLPAGANQSPESDMAFFDRREDAHRWLMTGQRYCG